MIEKTHICVECGQYGGTHTHEIVYKSQATYMRNIKVNQIELCLKHHTASPTGIHHNEEMMHRYRKDLQEKYYEMFPNKYHSAEEIQKALECTDFDLYLILKKMCLYRYGYEQEQLILRLMGGKKVKEGETK